MNANSVLKYCFFLKKKLLFSFPSQILLYFSLCSCARPEGFLCHNFVIFKFEPNVISFRVVLCFFLQLTLCMFICSFVSQSNSNRELIKVAKLLFLPVPLTHMWMRMRKFKLMIFFSPFYLRKLWLLSHDVIVSNGIIIETKIESERYLLENAYCAYFFSLEFK